LVRKVVGTPLEGYVRWADWAVRHF